MEVKTLLRLSAAASMERFSISGSKGQIGAFHGGPCHCCTMYAPIAMTVTCANSSLVLGRHSYSLILLKAEVLQDQHDNPTACLSAMLDVPDQNSPGPQNIGK